MGHRFLVTVGKYELGAWSQVSGLQAKWGLADYWAGDSNQYFKYAGVPKYDPIKLKRAAEKTGTTSVQDWLREVQTTGGLGYEGSVTMYTSDGGPVITWEITEIFPITWQIADFDAGAGKVAVETLEFVHGGFLGPEGTWKARTS